MKNSSVYNATIDSALELFRILDTINEVMYSVFSLGGVAMALWLILCLTASWELRSRLRHQLMTSLLVTSLLDSAIILPYHLIAHYLQQSITCTYVSVFNHLVYIEDFIANWTVVILLAVHLAEVCDYDPTRRVRVQWQAVAMTVALIASPYIVAVILVPTYNKMAPTSSSVISFCGTAFDDVLRIIAKVTPSFILLGLLVVIIVMRHKKLNQGKIGSDHTELMGESPKYGPLLPYLLITVSVPVCDQPSFALFHIILNRSNDWSNWKNNLIFGTVFAYLTQLKNILLPAIFLLFPDIREETADVSKRLWGRVTSFVFRRPRAGIDLTVNYKAEP